ncbi:MAG: hypothetical protein ACRD2G_03765 [Terriglobia bacterium]
MNIEQYLMEIFRAHAALMIRHRKYNEYEELQDDQRRLDCITGILGTRYPNAKVRHIRELSGIDSITAAP